METVLIVGATGNIGTAAAIAALKGGRKVLAIVRNEASANKLFQNVGTREGITTVEADVISDTGVQSVVEKVKAGKLPSFQHVWASVGGPYGATPMTELDTKTLHEYMSINFEANFYAYRATVPYLLEQKYPTSTWTMCTGSQGDIGLRAGPAISQGPLFSMANVACRDLFRTNIRFNEVYLNGRVEIDTDAAKSGATKASDFAKIYQKLLDSPEIRSCRVTVNTNESFDTLKFKPKHADL